MKFTSEYSTLVSIVIPVKNSASTLDECLRSIKNSYYKNIEVLVVDDHSTDNGITIAKRYNCRIIQVGDGNGANNARNIGASSANGDIFLFLDSDISIGRDTILTVLETLDDEGTDAVVGVYTAKHRNENLVSQYKNLWIRYSYMKSPPAIDWLFGAISGIKREAFKQIGGFDVSLTARHGNDDIELGKRFSKANLNIVLNLDIEVEHLKNYTLRSFIKNEFHRSIGFASLAARLGEASKSVRKGFVNVYPSFVISTVISIVMLLIIAGHFVGLFSPWVIFAGIILYLGLNIKFLNFLEQVRGLFAMLAMIPILFIDHVVCLLGSIAGIMKGWKGKK
jgi:glycosyltransferase involved in cell wall biosynthesis